MSKIKAIFSNRLAGYLMYSGFMLQRIEDDDRKPGRKMFIFVNSDELSDCIGKYRKEKVNWEFTD